MAHSGKLLISLSEREQEVYTLILEGHGNKEIAVKLGLAQQTINHHGSSIYQKFGVKKRIDLFYFEG